MSRPGHGGLMPVNGLGFPPQNVARVVVWEWLNEHSRWRPYTATVCHHIENVLKEDARGSVVLGQVDSRLAPYIIDLQSMHQFRQDTGCYHPDGRSFSHHQGKHLRNLDTNWGRVLEEGLRPGWQREAVMGDRGWVEEASWGPLGPGRLGCQLLPFSSQAPGDSQPHRRTSLINHGPLDLEQVGQGQPQALPTVCLGSLHPVSRRHPLLHIVKLKLRGLAQATEYLGQHHQRPAHAFRAGGGDARDRPPSQLSPSPSPPLTPFSSFFPPSSSPTSSHPPPHPSKGAVDAPGGAPTPGQNNLNRPGPQRTTSVSARASIPPGVPALPVKNLNGTGPVHPALAGMTGILLCAAGLPVCLTRAPKPILHPPPVSKSDVKPVPGVPGVCRKTKKKHLKKSKNPEDVVRRYMQKVKNPPDEDCTICMERLVTASGYEGVLRHKGVRPELVGRLGRCGHMYHLLCLVAMYSNGNKDGSLQCPTCKAIYGEKTGTQPPGKMEFHLIPHSLPGFPDTQTIRIVYDIPTGIQGPEHPNPGKKFTARGFPRHCYLPNNEKGRKVLRLLITAWERRLIFTIGTSNTTGESDTVVWNEIHHKTEFGSNLTGHGYPDASYLDNVLAELTAQGVSEAAAKA
ncbi:hypothetical protein EGM_03780 [Macaca fascicularis]|uniref:E3 ubiquitin-protein ligase n=2 Tax=Simiiformes TaxID=314293 RepID=G7PIQ6_MACFA|nr:hypothetical protein EGM_03780 [Macaca fascicularis]